MRRVVLLAALLLASCGGNERGEQPVPATGPLLIVQDDAELLHRDSARIGATLDFLRAIGTGQVRITAGWDEIERSGWTSVDRAVAMARERSLEVMIDIAFWAPPDAVSRRLGARERWKPDPRRYADFAAAVAERYRDDATSFALWNEPNHNVFLLPQWERRAGEWVPRSPHVYRAMVAAAHPRVKAVAPDATVLVGNTSSTGAYAPRSPGSRMPPLRFLRELACVDGQLDPVTTGPCADFAPIPGDGWAHHPYGQDAPPEASAGRRRPDDVPLADLQRLIDLLRALHGRGRLAGPMPVWITEYGYQTNPPDPTRAFSPAQQADFLRRARAMAAAHGDDVRSFAQFLVRDLPERPGPTPEVRWRDYQSGLLFEDGRPKPAARVFTVPSQ